MHISKMAPKIKASIVIPIPPLSYRISPFIIYFFEDFTRYFLTKCHEGKILT